MAPGSTPSSTLSCGKACCGPWPRPLSDCGDITMNTDMLWLLALGAGGGLLHALDADHILAVSTVAAGGDASRRRVLRTAPHWAPGHGLARALVPLRGMGFGRATPD